MKGRPALKIIFRSSLSITPVRTALSQPGKDFQAQIKTKGTAFCAGRPFSHLLSAENQSLLYGWNALLLFYPLLDFLDLKKMLLVIFSRVVCLIHRSKQKGRGL